MSAVEMATAVRIGSASPLQFLQARVFRRGRVESGVLLLVAIAGPMLLFVLGLAVRVPGPGLLAMLLIPAPAIEGLVALRYRYLWPAQEVLGWIDITAVEVASSSDPGLSPGLVAAHMAYRAALKAVASGSDGVAQLGEARPLIGALPLALVRRLWLNRLRYVIASAIAGAWLWTCLIVALGTASGVVWF